jgi:hypothetical protein
MIKYHQEFAATGTGLGYQISSYVLMRSIANRTGYSYTINTNGLKALRNTFTNLQFNSIKDELDVDLKSIEFLDDHSFEEVVAMVEDNCELYGYPTVKSMVDSINFESVKKELRFRPEVVDKCRQFMSKFDGQEVISMHLRRGDFEDISSGMFLIDDDYYKEALELLPPNIPVLIFCNVKDYILTNPILTASDPERFTFVLDIFNDNELINCDVGQELDRLVDASGECRFDYKAALAKHAYDNLMPSTPTQEELNQEMVRLVKELHPTYKEKIANNLYNYSFELCLMSMCDYHIMANSTFSMWGVELSNTKKVIYPKYWMQGHDEDTRNAFAEIGLGAIKIDLGGYNQTRDLAEYIIDKPHYIGLENPDQRSFTVVS